MPMWFRLGIAIMLVIFVFVVGHVQQVKGNAEGAGCFYLLGMIASIFVFSWILTGGE